MARNDDFGAERECRWHIDVDRKENFVLVSVVDDRPVGDALRLGPQDWPALKSGGRVQSIVVGRPASPGFNQ
jgi:hypothetical protein